MHWTKILALALAVPSIAVVRFHCSQLNSFNATMDTKKDMPGESTCTTCQYAEDFSNYWTAVMYFRAQNGSYKRVPQLGNNQFTNANGGLTVYYMQDAIYDQQQKSKVTAFQPGFRMFIGDIAARTLAEAARFRQLTYTCLDTFITRQPEMMAFPDHVCKEGIMTTLRFPTCWDGKNLDSPDHMAHISYPETGTFESGGPCPSTHPVRTGQVMFEVVWDTKPFNNLTWPTGGKNPFVWSFGDATGYANHADYVFGWKGDALQKILDTPCIFNCTQAGDKIQAVDDMNKCTQKAIVDEDIDSWLPSLPGGFQAEYGPTF
ncbi:uncharacterized protein LY89DRAFT_697871 [Mollisia scopiformis]|uniref:DUF1996 domain-containing protein n=1 Tax=Mollisia scopiformis TaxID=149040 RepID=A0A194X6M7_MOLSC|nr:uncharacterized protein LY89DRAFT_697871 [Mollisia scopiformis]KUJ15835.1 hypothetical protein LY89DRAFT_697871 [Mollisia scopiformis]